MDCIKRVGGIVFIARRVNEMYIINIRGEGGEREEEGSVGCFCASFCVGGWCGHTGSCPSMHDVV